MPHLQSGVRMKTCRVDPRGGGGVCVSPGWSLEMGEKGRQTSSTFRKQELAGHLWSDGAWCLSGVPLSFFFVPCL